MGPEVTSESVARARGVSSPPELPGAHDSASRKPIRAWVEAQPEGGGQEHGARLGALR